MKSSFGMLLMLTLGLVGCGRAEAPPVESSPTTLPAATTAPPAQAAEYDADLAELEKLGAAINPNTGLEIHVEEVNFRDTQVTDAGLVHLKGLTNLKWLDLTGSQVTDAGLVHLKGLTKLEWLDLDGTQVTGAGLVHLKGLTNLEELYLWDTQVTDAGLEHLKGLTDLEWLWLDLGQVTEAGVAELERALPNCHINH